MIESSIDKSTSIEKTQRRNDFITELRNSANLEIDDRSRLWHYEHKNRGYDIDIWMKKR
ncbi:MAG: hypothetical protein HFJ42_00420 [Clostridia bacterium]|nr:hypothetical protein [Clostridia bacterium]